MTDRGDDVLWCGDCYGMNVELPAARERVSALESHLATAQLLLDKCLRDRRQERGEDLAQLAVVKDELDELRERAREHLTDVRVIHEDARQKDARLAELEREVEGHRELRCSINEQARWLSVTIALPFVEADQIRMATEDWIVERIKSAIESSPAHLDLSEREAREISVLSEN